VTALLRDIAHGLRAAPARAALAAAALAAGLVAATILLAVLTALRRESDRLLSSFGANSALLLFHPADGEPPIPARALDPLLAALAPDAALARYRLLPAAPDSPPGLPALVAVDPGFLAAAPRWHLLEGRPLDARDALSAAPVLLAPSALCRENRWQVGRSLTLGRRPFLLVGRTADAAEDVLFPPRTVFLPLAPSDPVDGLLLRALPGRSPETLRRRADNLLRSPGLLPPGTATEWITPASLLAGVRQWQRAVAWTAGTCGTLALALGATLLAGLVASSVQSRTREIGLRRSLGATRPAIATLFAGEALLLALAAAAAALPAAALALRLLGPRFPFPWTFGPPVLLAPPALALLVALACAAGPAAAAARIPPAEALRND
jgi:putative ABC transport system permease protein